MLLRANFEKDCWKGNWGKRWRSDTWLVCFYQLDKRFYQERKFQVGMSDLCTNCHYRQQGPQGMYYHTCFTWRCYFFRRRKTGSKWDQRRHLLSTTAKLPRFFSEFQFEIFSSIIPICTMCTNFWFRKHDCCVSWVNSHTMFYILGY